MSHGVKKETYVQADEATTKALTFDLLDHMYTKIDALVGCHEEHIKVCNGRFKNIEDRKKKDTAIAGGSGVLGGFIAVISIHIKNWLSG